MCTECSGIYSAYSHRCPMCNDEEKPYPVEEKVCQGCYQSFPENELYKHGEDMFCSECLSEVIKNEEEEIAMGILSERDKCEEEIAMMVLHC